MDWLEQDRFPLEEEVLRYWWGWGAELLPRDCCAQRSSGTISCGLFCPGPGRGAGESCWVVIAGSEDMTRDLINLLCSGGAGILQELCQGLQPCWTWRGRFLIWAFLGWLVGMGIEVSELGQECACYSGKSFKNKEERTVKIHGLYVFIGSVIYLWTSHPELCHWLKKKLKKKLNIIRINVMCSVVIYCSCGSYRQLRSE